MSAAPWASALALRIEALAGPCRETDAAIAVAIKLGCRANLADDLEYLSMCRKDDDCAPGTYWFHCRSGKSLRTAPMFTASFDAAATIMPPDAWFILKNWMGPSPNSCDMFVADVLGHSGKNRPIKLGALCATPALALCAASIRDQVLG